MARQAEPWRRKGRGWYAQLEGRQIWLAPKEATKDQAWAALHRERGLIGHPGAQSASISVRDLCNRLLTFTRRERKSETYEGYRRHLKTFVELYGSMPAADIKPLHVERWIEERPRKWGPTTRRNAITAVKRVFRWGLKQGFLNADPLLGVEKPQATPRQAIPDEAELQRIVNLWDEGDPFRELLKALLSTGARPGELMIVTAAHLRADLGQIVLTSHKTAGSTGGRPRVIYLAGPAVKQFEDLAKLRPQGPLFRNSKGDPWQRNALACRFGRKVRAGKISPGMCAQVLRHGFTTGALQNGVPIADLAELLGHKSTAMISKHYSHLHARGEHLRRAAERAIARNDPPQPSVEGESVAAEQPLQHADVAGSRSSHA